MVVVMVVIEEEEEVKAVVVLMVAKSMHDLVCAWTSGEFLDESRAFTREFIRSFSAKYGNKLWIVFPDGKEVRSMLPPLPPPPLPLPASADTTTITRSNAINL